MSSIPEPASGGGRADGRPALAIVSDHVTPYRIHLHRRIARELPEVRLLSVFVTVASDFTWKLDLPPEIGPIVEAEGHDEPLSWRLADGWRKARRILARLRREGAAAMVVNGYYRPSLFTLLLLGRRHGLKVFLRADSNVRGDRPRGAGHALLKRALLRGLLRRCDGLMPMGRLGNEYFDRYGARRDNRFLVPYEPDYDRFAHVAEADVRAFRERFGLTAGRRRLLCSGRLAAAKRVDLVVDAFLRLAEERPEWDLVVAGDGPLATELRRRVPPGRADRVRWLGFLAADDMPSAYHACDAFVIASDVEPWAVVVNEAVAAGLPVVASDAVGAAHELVRDGASGRIFPAGSLEDLAAALREATDDRGWERLRAGVPAALARWRAIADPVAGLRAALQGAGVVDG